MKHFLFTALMVLVFAANGFAFGDVTYEDNSTTNAPVAIAAPVSSANAVSGANATALANQQQGQLQGQMQGQQQGQVAVGFVGTNIGTKVNTSVVVEKPLYEAPAIQMQNIPILQSGRIGDFTAAIPKIKGLKKLSEDDSVVKILAVYDGFGLWRIRLEDVEADLIDKASAYPGENVRYTVRFKDSVTSASIGAGGGATASMDNGLIGGAATGSTGYSQSTANPQFIITFYEVE